MGAPQRRFILGPTASGKSSVALAVAPALGCEVFSMDSMLVYRGMDIGTDKPSAAEQASVKHHLIDLVEPSESFSVQRYIEAADAAEADAATRGAAPLYVGGTGLYLKARTAGLFEGPAVPTEVRSAVEAELAADGGREALRAELERVDPQLFQKLHPNDDKRLLRAIETFRASGKPLGEWQAQWQRQEQIGAPAVAIAWPREHLRKRVAQRFDEMLAEGFLDEVRRIREQPGFSASASKALGYRQLLEHLDGQLTLQEARDKAVTLTRTFIRRQMTWLRSFPDLHWLEPEPETELEVIARQAADRLA